MDICENASGITFQADMPSVPKDGLDIKVDKDSLSIEGAASIVMAGNMEALYADYGLRQLFAIDCKHYFQQALHVPVVAWIDVA